MSRAIAFDKFHGAGNDFIMLDGRRAGEPGQEDILFLCDRHRGIGADGLIIVHPLEKSSVSMRYYNSDGLESTMCGNGGRCVAAWAKFKGLCGNAVRIHASDGPHTALILSDMDSSWEVRLQMADAALPLSKGDHWFMNTGSPHHIIYIEDVSEVDVVNAGRAVRYSADYSPGGTNVDFVQRSKDSLLMRTYERGVEDETLACGTGVTAVALTDAWLMKETGRGSKKLSMPGGLLTVDYVAGEKGFSEVWLQGPAAFVFSGEIILPSHE